MADELLSEFISESREHLSTIETDLLAIDQWRALYLFEFGLALLSFVAIALVRLPPSVREKSFEFLDHAPAEPPALRPHRAGNVRS